MCTAGEQAASLAGRLADVTASPANLLDLGLGFAGVLLDGCHEQRLQRGLIQGLGQVAQAEAGAGDEEVGGLQLGGLVLRGLLAPRLISR